MGSVSNGAVPGTTDRAGTIDVERVVLAVLGAYQVALGLVMLAAPGLFFETLGPFGPRNDHYTFDAGTFQLTAGLLFLGAVRWRAWVVPALFFGVVQWGTHTLSHLLDIGDADPAWIGIADFAGLLVATTILTVLLARAVRRRGWAPQ